MRIRAQYRILVILLAFCLAFEPFAVTMLRANDMPEPELNTDGIEGIVAIDEVMSPNEYLEYMLALRGRTKEEAEAKAWGEWMTSLTGAYMLMDDGCSDVFSFYGTMSKMQPHMSQTPFYFEAVARASSKATLAFAFVANSQIVQSVGGVISKTGSAVAASRVGDAARWTAQGVSSAAKWTGGKVASTRLFQQGVGFFQRKANMFNGFQKAGAMFNSAQTAFSAKNVTNFLSHMAPPRGYKAGVGEGFYSYWRWVARKTGLENVPTYRNFAKKVGINTNRGAKVIDNAKGLGHTVGIGLCVLGIAFDSYGIATSEDRKGGRFFSYSLVKNYVGLALGSAALIAMFCVPVVGQVVAALALGWLAISTLGNVFGDYNKRWKSAYKGSFWYLYENDPEFKSFYDNRGSLKPEEKAAALIITEEQFGDFIKAQPVANEEDQKIQDKNERVYAELEKQGVLVSFYSQKGYTLPDFGMERLKELWNLKADYMSWKPTQAEQEKAERRGFWGKVGHYVNPMTYISWAGDKVKSGEYEDTVANYNLQKVFFNPDYVLIKKYQNWVTANKHRGGIFDVVGLRIEQSPFNYIPLVGIDSAAWSEELLIESFNADAFQIGVKELMYFKEQLKFSQEQVKEAVKQTDKMVEHIREIDLTHAEKVRTALERLVDCYQIDSEREHDNLMRDCRRAFGWRWNNDNGDPTPANIIRVYQLDIEQSLMYDPLSVAQKAAEVVLLLSAIKQNLDLAAMMRELGEEKRAMLADFDEEFTNYDLAKFLKEGTFLDVKGSTFADWLADIYPAYDEMEKFTNLYMREVDKFTEVADESNSDTRSRWYWFDKHGMHPKEILHDLNSELDRFKEVAAKFEEIKDDAGLEMPLSESENSEFYANVYTEYEPVVADPENDVLYLDSPVIPPGDDEF
jgi:DNA-binding transcriptional regulator YhcF (GntR family)